MRTRVRARTRTRTRSRTRTRTHARIRIQNMENIICWPDFSVFLSFSRLPGLPGALLGAVDIDLIPRILLSGPELLVLSLFPKMMESVHMPRCSQLTWKIQDSLTNFNGRYHGNLVKEYSQLIWKIQDSLTNFHGRYRAHGNLVKELSQLIWRIEDSLTNFHGRYRGC